jgi:hypothetical protein
MEIQMSDFSKPKLLEFLDYLKNKGLMNAATVSSRKAAANAFLGILSNEEAADLRKLDLDEVALRFSNLKGDQFKPESIKVYKSRVASALEDFKSYRANPLTFKPSTSAPKPSGSPSAPKAEKAGTKSGASKQHLDFEEGPDVTFPVPIRSDVVVRLVGLPSDLTKKEAAKIANVVLALATEDDPEPDHKN